MVVAAAGMCFTWPTLEALVSEGESRAGLQHMVGIYNTAFLTILLAPNLPVLVAAQIAFGGSVGLIHYAQPSRTCVGVPLLPGQTP